MKRNGKRCRRSWKLSLSAIALAITAPAPLVAQPAFEVVSINAVAPGAPCEQSMIAPLPGGGLRVECVSLKGLLTWAYQIQNYQLSGGPAWISTERWNILAKPATAPDPAIPTEYEKMSDAQRRDSQALARARVKSLLAERFKLVVRTESREQTIYALTVAKGGPKLKESEDQAKSEFIMGGRRGVIEGRNSFVDSLAQYLGIQLARPVINQTGLTRHYDFKLTWTPESLNNPNPPEGPTVFTAIQEQLGLKLESAKGPVEMLVIESASKPEN